MYCWSVWRKEGVGLNLACPPSSIHPLVTARQRVVTNMLPVEAFATAIKFIDLQKVCLIICFLRFLIA